MKMELHKSNNKLAIICRDGLTINNFLKDNNLTKDNVLIVKSVGDLSKLSGIRDYVIMTPFPDGFHWSIRPKLVGMNNVSKKYFKSYYNF